MKFIGEYDNGYCENSDNVFFFEADNIDAVYAYMAEGLYDWAEQNVIGVEGYTFGEGFDSQEDEDYYFDNCDYVVTEVDEDEFFTRLEDEGFEKDDVIKL
jgi:hypothetical protein